MNKLLKHLINGIQLTMRNDLMSVAYRVLLQKRLVGETLLSTLRPEMGVEYKRQRSPSNAIEHMVSPLVANTPGKSDTNVPDIAYSELGYLVVPFPSHQHSQGKSGYIICS